VIDEMLGFKNLALLHLSAGRARTLLLAGVIAAGAERDVKRGSLLGIQVTSRID
jgi:hypothetical protein